MGKGKVFLLLGLGLVLAGCGLLPEQPLLPPDRAPEGLQASFGTARNAINLSWSEVERASVYKIFRAESADGEFVEVGQTSSTSYRDQVGEEGKWYWYKVRACNSAGCGPYSTAVRGYAGRPPAPEKVRASEGTYTDKIVISWDPVPGATYYHVFRDRARDGDYRVVVGEYLTQPQAEDKNVSPATWYWYKVVACNNEFGCSVLSEAARGYCGPYPVMGLEDEPLD